MPTYVIERDLPGAGQLSGAELKEISAKSNAIISELGHGLAWLHSYVSDNKIFCVYKSPNEALLEEHAKCGGFPITAIREVKTIIDPSTGK